MRSRIILILWILGILFPMAFLGRLWPAFGTAFNRFFATAAMHVLFHACLYAVLVFLLAQWMKPETSAAFLKVLAGVFLVGLLHEAIQVALAGVWPGWAAELTDLGVDLGGGAIGLALASLLVRRKRYSLKRIESK